VTARRAVLLSGSLGMGHEMLVRSCSSVLRGCGWQVQSFDCMELLGHRLGALGERLFTRLIGRAPGIYDGLHFAHLRAGSPLADGMARGASARLAPALRQLLGPTSPDLVLSVFATGAAAAATLRRVTGLGARTVVLCTDVTLHRVWAAEGTDLFLATSPAAAASVLRYLPRANVAVIPPPVRASFYDAPSQAKARADLGIRPEGVCALVLDSGWGFGPLAARVQAMARAGFEVLAVAGRQASVEARFRALAARDPRVHPFGFVEDVPRLMAAADVVIAMPGATTCSEARVVGRPLLLLDLMLGHGRENALHELELGDATVCGARPADVVESVRALLERRSNGLLARRAPVGRWEPPFLAALRAAGLDAGGGTDERRTDGATGGPPEDRPERPAGPERATRRRAAARV
jgi:processive 1,2-diacylglycerol beta-glucosyltransferase